MIYRRLAALALMAAAVTLATAQPGIDTVQPTGCDIPHVSDLADYSYIPEHNARDAQFESLFSLALSLVDRIESEDLRYAVRSDLVGAIGTARGNLSQLIRTKDGYMEYYRARCPSVPSVVRDNE